MPSVHTLRKSLVRATAFVAAAQLTVFAYGATATQNLTISGGTGFSGTIGGDITAVVKNQTTDGSVKTQGLLNITDLDIQTKSSGGFFNVFPNSTSNNNTASTKINIAPTTVGINIPTTPFSSPVSGAVSVTAGDNVADEVPGSIDPGVPGSDGKWDDPAKTGILNGASADSFGVSLNNDINAAATVSGGFQASIPSNVTIPNVVNTTFLDVDLVLKNSSTVSVNFAPSQNMSLKNLTLTTSSPIALGSPSTNFTPTAHPTGYPQLDLSTAGAGLVQTTVSGTLVADLMGTVDGSIDLRANIEVIGIITFPVDFDNAIDGQLSNGVVPLIALNESIALPDVELPFFFSVLHSPTANIDVDDVFASLATGTFGLTLPVSVSEPDVVLDLPPTSFEMSSQSFHVDEGVFAEGDVILNHLAGTLTGQIVLDLAADLEISANMLATAYQSSAINVLLPALGDANGDGVVDGTDYTIWADHYLQTGQPWTHGDFNFDGLVDGSDYTVWADHWSPAPAAGASVLPEPATWVLLALGGIACLAIRRRAKT